jgi:hypothetical protein
MSFYGEGGAKGAEKVIFFCNETYKIYTIN